MNLRRLRKKLPLPESLTALMRTGRWVHPGDEVIRSKIPFLRDPLDFLPSFDAMLSESGPLMGPYETENVLFSEYRGSAVGPRELPWIDVEQTIYILCNRRPGDDVGIALDYRTGRHSPRVVGSDCFSGNGVIYHEIAPSFDAFAALLDLGVPAAVASFTPYQRSGSPET